MFRARFVALLLFAVLALVSGCRGTAEPPAPQMPQPGPAGYYDLSPDRLAEMLAQGDEFALVNVHIPYAGEIAGTDAHIPYNEISDYLDRLPGQEDVIVLYCRSGPMSITAAKTLVQQGYTNVWELNGGMVAWTAAGYELVNE